MTELTATTKNESFYNTAFYGDFFINNTSADLVICIYFCIYFFSSCNRKTDI